MKDYIKGRGAQINTKNKFHKRKTKRKLPEYIILQRIMPVINAINAVSNL
jgi:hypothetical protein